MDPMNVLVVERGADYRLWSAASHVIGHAMLVLVQQVDESTAAFRARVQARLSRISQGLGSLVLLRGRRGPGLTAESLIRGLAQRAPKDVRTFTHFFSPGLGFTGTAA